MTNVSDAAQAPANISNPKFLFCDIRYPVGISYKRNALKTYPLYTEFENKVKDERAVVDDYGAVYKQTWKRDDKSTTPFQRTAKKYRSDEIEYHRFSEGLISYERSLAASLLYAEGAAPLLEDSYLIASALHLEIRENGVTGNHLKSLAMLSTLEGLEEVVRRRSNPSLGEARKQIRELLLWVRDRQGKPVLVIFQARWDAMVDRFGERLVSLQSWNDDYLERLERVVAVKDRFYLMIDRLANRLAKLKNQASQDWGPPAAENIKSYCKNFVQEMERWKRLRPFNSWTSRMSADARKLEAAADSLSRTLVLGHIDKMTRSISFQFFHKDIDELIQFMSEVAPSVRLKKSDHLREAGRENLFIIGNRLGFIANQLFKLDDRYFKRKVVKRLKDLWRSQMRQIQSRGGRWRTMELTDPSQYADIRETLKEMSKLL